VAPVAPPSALLLDRLPLLRAAAALGPVLDLACGRGRNALALAREGIDCIGLDRNRERLRALREAAASEPGKVDAVLCDLERDGITPVKNGSCGVILVFRFLFRPLAPAIEHALAPGGILIYETFTRAQPAHGWGPKSPDFLLEPGELPGLFPGLEILHHDERPVSQPRPEASARLVARRPATSDPARTHPDKEPADQDQDQN